MKPVAVAAVGTAAFVLFMGFAAPNEDSRHHSTRYDAMMESTDKKLYGGVLNGFTVPTPPIQQKPLIQQKPKETLSTTSKTQPREAPKERSKEVPKEKFQSPPKSLSGELESKTESEADRTPKKKGQQKESPQTTSGTRKKKTKPKPKPTPVPETPAPKRLSACRTMREVLPGKLVKDGSLTRWEPDNCKIVPVGRQLLKGKHVVVYGDVLGIDLAKKLAWSIGAEEDAREPDSSEAHFSPMPADTSIIHFWAPPFRSVEAERAGALLTRKMVLRQADLIILTSALLDLGALRLGPSHFFDIMLERIAKIKSRSRWNSRFIVATLHGVDNKQQDNSCFSEERAAVIREALQMSAACAHVEYLDPYTVVDPVKTKKRIGMWKKNFYAEADILANALRRHKPMSFYPTIACEPEKAKKRWAQVPGAAC